MAIDSYVFFLPYTGSALASESQVDMSKNTEDLASDLKTYASSSQLFEVTDYSFDVEQTLNIGSAGSGTSTLQGGSGTDFLQGNSGNTLFIAGSGTETKIGRAHV